MFWPFPNWPSSGWNKMSEELYTSDIVFQSDDGQLGNGRNM